MGSCPMNGQKEALKIDRSHKIDHAIGVVKRLIKVTSTKDVWKRNEISGLTSYIRDH